MAGAKTAAKKGSSVAMAKPPEVFYRINSLLYTLRAIAQREDQLCVLMHHLRTSGKLNAAMAAELEEIVDELPTQAYLHEVEALQQSLEAATSGPKATGAKATARPRGATKKRAA